MIPLKTFQNLTKTKQDIIIQAAVEEFSEKGYAGASINSLVNRLGIAKGSIFQYFGDKKGLFLFVFNKSIDMIKDDLREIRDRPTNEDLFTRLEKTFEAGVIFLKEHPRIYKLYLKVLFESEIPFRNEILLSLRKNSLDYIRSLLETAKQRGEIRNDIDIAKASFVVDAVMDRFLQAQTVLHLDAGLGLFKCSELDAKGWIENLVDIIRLGIGNIEREDKHIMDASKDTIVVNANVEMTTRSLQIIVENAKQKAGRDEKGVYRVDTADKVSEMISRFLLEKDFEGYVKNIGTAL